MPRDSSVEFSEETIEQVWNKQDGRCLTCGIKLSKNNHEKGEKGAWHAHHILPVACKGEGNIENCAILCVNTCHKLAHPDPHDCTKTPSILELREMNKYYPNGRIIHFIQKFFE